MAKKQRRKGLTPRQQKLARIQAVILIISALFTFITLVSYNRNDFQLLSSNPQATANLGGTVGVLLAEGLFRLTGNGAFVLPFFLIFFAVPWYKSADIKTALRQSTPLFMLQAAIVMMLGLTHPQDPSLYGLAGRGILGITLTLTGRLGSWLISSTLLVGFIAVFFRIPLLNLLQQLRSNRKKPASRPRPGREKRLPGSEVFFEQKPGATRSPDNTMIFKAGLPRKELLRRFKEQALATEEPVPLITKVYIEETATGHTQQPEMEPFEQGTEIPETMEREQSDPLHDWKHSEPVQVDQTGYSRYQWQDQPEIKLQNEFPDRYDRLMSRPDEEEQQHTVTPEPVEPLLPENYNTGIEEPPVEQPVCKPEEPGTVQQPGPNVVRFPGQKPKPAPKRKSYRKPDSSLLAKSSQEIDDEMRRNMQMNAEILENTFSEFNIEARVTNISRGPVITRFEISIPPGVKLNRVSALQDNIALNLAAASVRIEAPIPGKSAIGIEIPNKKRSMVTLRDILETKEFKNSRAKIPIALGQTVSGSSMVTDLAAMPHLIIAGTTGSGKSVCVNGIICSILYNMLPDRVRLILVDPKYVELAPYNGIPHLLTPVINKPRAAVQALKWLVGEMERRYLLLQQMACRNITSFNNKIKEEQPRDPESGEPLTKMPYLVVVIDELADLMLLAAKEIEDSISRLAAMSRAVGIHLIFATQRPSVDVITGVIKNNFPARIAFQVASTTDSRTILDKKGAEKLLGQGDSLFVGPGSPYPQRLQGAFLSEEEVDKTAAWLRSIGEPEYNMEIVKDAPEGSSDDFGEESEEDELFPDAVEVVITSQRASASYLQRRLKVGYNRAARMIEMMEEEGIIGPPQGSKPREILVSQWERQ